jgi:hypothetical protein
VSAEDERTVVGKERSSGRTRRIRVGRGQNSALHFFLLKSVVDEKTAASAPDEGVASSLSKVNYGFPRLLFLSPVFVVTRTFLSCSADLTPFSSAGAVDAFLVVS